MTHDDVTEPLPNGADLPKHPANTTGRKVISYGKVLDAEDGRPLRAGLHQNEIRMLMAGHAGGLGHLYAFAMLNDKIFHTRQSVVVDVKTIDVDDHG